MIDFHSTPQLKVTFDPAQNTLWSRWSPAPRPCFTHELLDDLTDCGYSLDRSNGHIRCDGADHTVDYCVLASAIPGIYNYGGDLALFLQLIRAQDRAGLLRYGYACIFPIYRLLTHYDLPLMTIALVQGECLGGGFEAALACNLIIAERNSRFGFPEILFNLFPGMGAYSILSRRVGQRVANEMIGSGRRYTAEEMFDMGIVDVIAEIGEGEAVARNWISKHRRVGNGLVGMYSARRIVDRLDYSELRSIVEMWVERALCLTDRDLALMQRLVTMQSARDAVLALQWGVFL